MKTLTSDIKNKISSFKDKFPEGRQRSAIIEALHLVQHKNEGYLTPELLGEVAEVLDVPAMYVYEVATFYSMFSTKPVGRNNVAICTNISCMLRGADEVVDHVEKKLEIKIGVSTSDGRI